jgi:alkylresorcinol/alkylpyrone synthase
VSSPDPKVVATATGAPAQVIGPDETRRCIREIFGGAYSDLQRAMRMVDHTGIDERHLSLPLGDLLADRSLTATQEIYAETIRTLGREVAEAALREAQMSADQVDCVIAVSCTGYLIPSLDVYLASDLGMRSDVRRLPITELGCGGGTAALALAADFVRAHPGSVALVVSVELCSLTFQKRDTSWQNVVAAMLFGDAAAAAVVTDRPIARQGPTIRAARSLLFPDTRSYMGFELRDSGLHLIMSPEVPEMVRKHFRPLRDAFLADHGLASTDVGYYVLHPGGAKILRYLRQEAKVPETWLAAAAEVLRRYGNVSSTTVLLVLDEVMRNRAPSPGATGILASLGPGFCAEMLLLGWEP